MIDDVVIQQLITFPDERGFFREVARFPAIGFVPRQQSHSMRVTGVSNGWHIHQYLSEVFYLTTGLIRVALKDCRVGHAIPVKFIYRTAQDAMEDFGLSSTPDEYQEIVLSRFDPKMLLIPHGVAHAYRVLQGECDIIYTADMTYDMTRSDEGRIEPDRWGIEWMRETEVK